MGTILVLGASGFIGGQLTRALLAEGRAIRCLSRDPARLRELAAEGCEVAEGDIADLPSLRRALDAVEVVYVAIHTLSPQGAGAADRRFMAVELDGLRNIVSACRENGVRRLIYVTSLGVAADAASEWLRERWRAEQALLESGLEVTLIRPGMIVGAGGRGFAMLASQARRPVAVFLGGRQRLRTIAIADLTYYLVGVLHDPRAYGQRYDVGNDDILTNSQVIDAAAAILGRRRPRKLPIPPALLRALAPLIERAGKLPQGSFTGFLDSLAADGSGDPAPIRSLLPRTLLSYRQAAERALAGNQT